MFYSSETILENGARRGKKNGKKFQEGGEENGWVKEGMRWQGEQEKKGGGGW